MRGRCLELEAFKMAREQAKSKVYTPPELFKIEERICSGRQKERTVYRCQDSCGVVMHRTISVSKLVARKNSK